MSLTGLPASPRDPSVPLLTSPVPITCILEASESLRSSWEVSAWAHMVRKLHLHGSDALFETIAPLSSRRRGLRLSWPEEVLCPKGWGELRPRTTFSGSNSCTHMRQAPTANAVASTHTLQAISGGPMAEFVSQTCLINMCYVRSTFATIGGLFLEFHQRLPQPAI